MALTRFNQGTQDNPDTRILKLKTGEEIPMSRLVLYEDERQWEYQYGAWRQRRLPEHLYFEHPIRVTYINSEGFRSIVETSEVIIIEKKEQ